MNHLQQMEARTRTCEKLQIMVNKVGLLNKVDLVKAIAMSAHSELPQYETKWDKGWELIRIHKQVKGKMGLYFEKGDYAIYNDEACIAYSVRIEGNTSMKNINFSEV